MSQKIKVQDGNILYEASDPAFDVNFGINGLLNVSKELYVGSGVGAGTITTAPGQSLIITTDAGNLSIVPDGALLLNSVQWPIAGSTINSGSFIGASALNTLDFYSFVIAYNPSDTLTVPDLVAAYPNAQSGQKVTGPSVVYECVGTSQWRILSAPLSYTPVNKAGDTMTGLLILSGDPVTSLGAATKYYVDNIAAGVNVHAACDTATIAALPSSTYDNGAGGPGATITASANGAIGTVGGYALLAVGSRILVKDQAITQENGIYVVTDLGSAGTPWVLTRADDLDGSPVQEISAGDLTYIQKGTLEGTQWIETAVGTGIPNDYIIVGTDPIIFSQFSGAGSYIAGAGIDISSNIISNIGVLDFNTRTGAITLLSTDVTDALGYTPGTVSSVDVSGGTTGLSFSGGPITTTGTTTMSGTLAIENGGTGEITSDGALNALLPTQTTDGTILVSDGTNTSWSDQIWMAPTGSVAIGPPVTAPQLSTTATDGFFYIPTCAGIPTGVPTNIPGRAPMVIDSVNNRLYIYAGGAWIALNLAVYS